MARVLRWIGLALGGILALALIVAGVLYAISGRKLAATHTVAAEPELVIPTDSASIARGAHLVGAIPCGFCHGADLGGKIFADAGPFGLLVGPNLTSGQGGRNPPLSDLEWERALRHGIRREGTSLVVMPSVVFHSVSDEDMASMIAYLKRLPPVDREMPPTTIRVLGRMFVGAGQFKLAVDRMPASAHVASVDTTPTPAYGRYLATITGCNQCHGPAFSGGPGENPDGVPISNITPTGIGHYTEEDFVRAMRTGIRPGGGAALSDEMPWQLIGTMTDAELRAIWLFLQTLPPRQFGEGPAASSP
jgi:cytochrome c553